MSRASLAPGGIVAFVGLSGSGKSTLALSLLRLLDYRGGDVTGNIKLAGRELIGLTQREMRAFRGKAMGYVPQSPAAALNDRLRVRTLLEETWRAHEPARPPRHSMQSFSKAHNYPASPIFSPGARGELSTGQGQRLLIALAIMHGPPVLLADEPTSALDADHAIGRAGIVPRTEPPQWHGYPVSFPTTCSRWHRSAIAWRFCTRAASWKRDHQKLYSARLAILSLRR